MARARNIKPGFFTNEDLVELDFATRLLFIGLWTEADRAGRLEDRPKKIKMALFPADNLDIDPMLQDLARMGFIDRYEVNGVKIIQIVAWDKHQNPHHTEKQSALPAKNTKAHPLDNGELTVNQRLQDGEYLADSLIPDSLIPDSTASAVSGPEPDGPEPTPPRAKNTKSLDYSNWPAVPSEEVFSDFKKLRQTKRAPITQTVIDKMATELKALERYGVTVDQALAIACERGWQGIKCEWVLNHLNLGSGNATGQFAGVAGSGVRKVSHSDQTRADAREALERLNGGNGPAAVRSTG